MDENRRSGSDRAAQRRINQAKAEAQARRRSQTKRRAQARKRAQQEGQVQYTPAKPLNRMLILVQLGATAAVVVALLLGVAIFFKVRQVQVTGNEKYTAEAVIAASGIENGENLLTFGKARAAGDILTSLPYVDTVQIGIKFPDTVMIQITELQVTYAIMDEDGGWWLMDSGGKLLENVTAVDAGQHTKVLGISALAPTAGSQLTPAADDPTVAEGTTLDAQDSGEARCKAVLEILSGLEENDSMGAVTLVDVSELYGIELWYGDQYQVLLGGPTDLTYKIRYMVQAVSQLADYQSGVLDLTFEEERTASFIPW